MKTAVLLSLLSLLALTVAEVKWLSPCPCSEQPDNCKSDATPTLDTELQKLAQRELVATGSQYQLQPGEHCVRHYSLVQHLVNISFQGPALISCTEGNGLAFINMTNLHLAHLAVEGCGLKLAHVSSFLSAVNMSVDYFFTLSNSSEQYVAMVLGNCVNFGMENSSISKTEGLGFLGINLMGQSTLSGVSIEQNVPRGCFSSNNYDLTSEKIGGGAMFLYHDYRDTNLILSAEFTIYNSTFEGNSYCGYGPIHVSYFQSEQLIHADATLRLGAGGGLSLILAQLDYQVNATIIDSIFRNNTALYGGGAHIQFFTGAFSSHVLFDNCMFQFNGLSDSEATKTILVGSAFLLFKDFIGPNFRTQQINRSYSPSQMVVTNSQFLNNTAFTATFDVHSLYNYILSDHIQYDIVLDNCTFEHNRAVTSPGIFLEEFKGSFLQLGTNVLLNDVTFSRNRLYELINITSPENAESIGVVVSKTMNLTISGTSLFSHNEATSLSATTTNVYILGNVTFFNNSGLYGGGISLSDSSALVVGKNVTLGFFNNTGVQAGGAFYVKGLNYQLGASLSDCFIYFISTTLECFPPFSSNCPDITKLGVEIIFEGNMSPFGNMIYGSTLNTCPWVRMFREQYAPGSEDIGVLDLLYRNQTNFTSPFRFDGPPQGITAVTTPPVQIAVRLPQETDDVTFLDMAPGIEKLINVTSFDVLHQATPAVIASRSLTPNIVALLGDNNFVLSNFNESIAFNKLRVFGSPNQTNVAVTIYAVSSFSQITLTVDISDCPDGYLLNQTVNACLCKQNRLDSDFSCTNDGRLLVPYGSWVGHDQAGVLLFGSCPLDYCKPEISIIPVLTGSDLEERSVYSVQCNSNYSREGAACGHCKEGYSTLLGSNRCQKCSNTSLLLLLLFAAYGVLLIAGMFLFQVTISGGFLDGLLFLSNVLTIYAPYLPGMVSASFTVFFWLSLKFNIESCFFDGMTALSSTALAFVFPLYLYFLLLVIVLLSRWSSRFSRWLSSRGCSPVKVFATILVMTYTSLLQTCLSILAFTPLTDVNTDKASYYWTYDPSVAYFQHYHAPLAVFAILLLILFLIPAPFFWMFPSKICSKYKPLYDAVWAPLKPRFRFWVSLRLILRIIPLIIVNFTPVPINLLLLCIFLLILLFVHGVIQPFQGSAQNAMDSLFQVELLAITLLTLYFARLDFSLNSQALDVDSAIRSNVKIRESDTIQVTLVILVVVSVYLSIVIVFVLHLMSQFPKLKVLSIRAWNYVMCKKFHLKQQRRDSFKVLSTSVDSPLSYGATETPEENDGDSRHTVATFSVLREPLLESSGLAEMYPVEN